MKLRREKITDDLEAYYLKHDWLDLTIFIAVCFFVVVFLFVAIGLVSASAPKDTSTPPKAVEGALERLTQPHKVTLKTFYAKVTSYSKAETCPHRPCITASRREARNGSLACPRNIRLGTTVDIAGTRYTCDDRTNIRYDGRWDIFQPSYSAARAFGIQEKQITILE